MQPTVRIQWREAPTLLFVILRWTNLYGNPRPWTPQANFLFTIFSFVDCHKYPPSLLYVLMTLGPALVLLSFLDRGIPRLLQPLIVFGRVPLFYFVLHLFLVRLLAFAIGGSIYGLPVVYAVWTAVVLIMYFPSRWFMKLKSRRRDWWLSYL